LEKLDEVSQLLTALERILPGKVMVLGVGNRLRGDDGVGSLIAEELKGLSPLAVLDCGEVPERFTGIIKEARPQTLLILDALDFKGRAGEIRLFEGTEIASVTFDTHKPSLSLLVKYLQAELGCAVYLLGIQPHSLAFGNNLNAEVAAAAKMIQAVLVKFIRAKVKTSPVWLLPISSLLLALASWLLPFQQGGA
jgi:hydrogenase 3 maturation protease